MAYNMDNSDRPLTAKEKRQEQLKRWENSATDSESSILNNYKPKVKFHDGAVFLAACSSGDLDEVQALLDKGADINFANVDGLTALHQACIDDNLDVVEFLVEHGTDIDQEDNEGWTPLHAAASCGFMDIARYLVDNHANVAAVNSEGEVPLDIAEEDDMVEFLQKQIDNQGLDIEAARNEEQEIMIADAKQHLNSIHNGDQSSIYRHPKSGATALHVAAAKGYIDVIRLLLQSGMDVNLRDNDGWTPLHAASHWSQQEAAKLLSDRGANFLSRSNLGQTPCDVADEDMLEYMRELQKENRAQMKESELINPLPTNTITNKTFEIHQQIDIHETKREFNEVHDNDVGVAHISAAEKAFNRDTLMSSSSDSEDDSTSSSEVTSSKLTEKQSKLDNDFITDKIGSRTDIQDTSSLTYSSSGSNVRSTTGFAGRRVTRPASLHISSTSANKDVRPTIMSAHELSSTRPIATTQPIQTPKSNGPDAAVVTPTERNSDIKDGAPSTWRLGLRKTGSFDEKMRMGRPPTGSASRGSQNDIDRSASYNVSKTQEEQKSSKSETRTARVAPIIDARLPSSKSRNTSADENEPASSFQRSGSYRRYANESTSTFSTATPISYKRSERSRTYSQPVTMDGNSPHATKHGSLVKKYLSNFKSEGGVKAGVHRQHSCSSPHKPSNRLHRSRSLDLPSNEADQISNLIRLRYQKLVNKYREPDASNKPNEATSVEEAADTSEQTNAAIDIRPDRRRSHLQPVRDEEAEAQRKARSRRERQTRRSTQGVTLDVFEEAKRTIDHMKQERSENASSSVSKQTDASDLSVNNDLGRIPHVDSMATNHRRFNSSASSSSNSPRTVTLPSGYIPSNERVRNTAKTAPITTVIPSINIDAGDEKQDPQKQDDDNADEGNSLTPGGQSPSARKSAAQQRRRQRKERRSTGLPGLKPSETTNTDNQSDDEETFKNDTEVMDDEKAERLKSTAARYDSSSLPDRHTRHRAGIRGSDNDLPSRFAIPVDDRKTDDKDYKKMYQDSRDENDRLQSELAEAKRRVTELEARLERADDVTARRKAVESEKRSLEKKLAEAEKELMVMADLKSDNQRLKDENGALIRVISKLSK
uniref:protein phosphatase 1 regulatory subunit 12A isoform X2 n=1 Tax=Ciona intestinalis TaxID=7719 RepID=UPI000EF44BB4|nr:protein phosphatase 1 regulatory subunit 12A isoform X2 [Ciona intestinalis]|eukprot:XP_026696402.1 protein phosphatase 1 regulatory subunit 12A isoform X2 [Ciona intestinalis]